MSRIGNKRQRTGVNTFVVSQKRPIDKGLVVVSSAVSSTQQETVLITATFPCTATGLRWDMSFYGDTTGANNGFWCIAIVRDGNAAATISLTDGAQLYQPEQDVLAFGSFHFSDLDGGTGSAQQDISGSTKSMRKLMGGDKLVFVHKSTNIRGTVSGCVQIFCKS